MGTGIGSTGDRCRCWCPVCGPVRPARSTTACRPVGHPWARSLREVAEPADRRSAAGEFGDQHPRRRPRQRCGDEGSGRDQLRRGHAAEFGTEHAELQRGSVPAGDLRTGRKRTPRPETRPATDRTAYDRVWSGRSRSYRGGLRCDSAAPRRRVAFLCSSLSFSVSNLLTSNGKYNTKTAPILTNFRIFGNFFRNKTAGHC